MARPTDDAQKKKFLAKLKELNGKCGNTQLRRELRWSESEYWRIHAWLIEDGYVAPGKGKGGSVILQSTEESEPREKKKEDDHYNDIRNVLQNEFLKEQGYEESIVEVCARLGRRDTGGRWSRPDLLAFGIRRFKYIPEKTAELISFEVKTKDSIDVTSFYEALAHNNRTSRSYLLFCDCTAEQFRKHPQAERIEAECEKHGIGLICIEKTKEFGAWDILLVARKAREYSSEIEQAIDDLMPDRIRQKIREMAKVKIRVE
jgi:hypothetical protein